LADDVNQKENSPETQPGDQSPPEVEELGQSTVSEDGVTELESLVAQDDEGLAQANARLTELEQVVAGKESEIATLTQAKDELEERLTTVSNSLAEAVASYKAMVVQANPEVIEELISGDTVDAINESLDKAKALVSKVRQGLETEISLVKVPAGAPERTPPDLSALSPREKIQYAIGGTR
jgi:chromosome segregation ATPase